MQKLENEHIKIILNPEIGGKMVSLFSKKTGTEYLLDSHSNSPVQPDYGDPFDLRFAYGFDDCFPTIKACQLQTENGTIDLPDHGELWSRQWEYYQKDEDSIILLIEGKQLDYRLIKEITLSDSSLNISYRLKNKSDASIHYIWSAHPLLSVEENDQVLLDCGDKVAVYWSNLEFQDKVVDWPPKIEKSGTIDLSRVQAVDADIAIKLFSAESSISKSGLYKQTADETIVFSFDKTILPYLGIWLCYGGWPEDKEVRSCTVALEPTNAQTDSLLEAIGNGEGSELKSNMIHQWEMQCSLISGRAKI